MTTEASLGRIGAPQAIRQLGTHELKEIIFGHDRHLGDVEAYTAVLAEFGDVIRSASETAHELYWVDAAARACSLVRAASSRVGVLICSTGIGMSIAANKLPGIYAARCMTVEDAELARTINNANVLCLASRLPIEETRAIVRAFFTTPYEGRKVDQLESITHLELERPLVRRRPTETPRRLPGLRSR